MLTSYQLALKHLSFNPGAGVTHISIGSSLTVFDLHHFRDTMTSKPSVGFSSQTYRYIAYQANNPCSMAVNEQRSSGHSSSTQIPLIHSNPGGQGFSGHFSGLSGL